MEKLRKTVGIYKVIEYYEGGTCELCAGTLETCADELGGWLDDNFKGWKDKDEDFSSAKLFVENPNAWVDNTYSSHNDYIYSGWQLEYLCTIYI